LFKIENLTETVFFGDEAENLGTKQKAGFLDMKVRFVSCLFAFTA
jgi:hypothetical protein